MLTKPEIEKYFLAEKQAALMMLIIGVIAVLAGLIFLFVFRANFFKGAAIPLLVLGILECIVGFAIHRRSDEDRVKIVYAYDMDPQHLKSEELPRMQEVNKKFMIYLAVEAALVLAGLIVLILYRGQEEKSFWVGLALSLIIQGVLLLGVEWMATQRAKEYTRKISAFLATSPQQQ